jgi:hypothetical protein
LRQEDKEVDGPELEQAEERKRENELVSQDDEELLDLDGKPYEMEKDRERSGTVVAAMRHILEGRHIVINDLDLSQRELKALEALKTAKTGKSGDLDRFVYAEDRRTLLEQALAVFQPDLLHLEGDAFDEMIKEVSDLRSHLTEREEAQDQVTASEVVEKTSETDTDDKDDDEDTSLDGPEREIDKPKSLLSDGKEVKPVEKPKSSLGDGKEAKPVEKPKSSLADGKEATAVAKGPTSLGDVKEIAAAEKALPFWRKPSNG